MTDDTPSALPLALCAGSGPHSNQWLADLLMTHGYAVLRSESGAHLLERAGWVQPDLIVIDAVLPDASGVELCRRLREDTRIGAVTPLALTTERTLKRVERLAALRAGAWEIIAPPHDGDELLLRLGTYVRAKLETERTRADGLLDHTTGLYNRQGLARRARELGSLATREHGALACVVVAVDVEPAEPGVIVTPGDTANAVPDRAVAAVTHSVQALKSAARLSDIIGRLGPAEFAVLAPGTDAAGAQRLAERMVQGLGPTPTASPMPHAEAGASMPALHPPVRVRVGYDAVPNLGYTPVEPLNLLARASSALRTGKPEKAGSWLRRFVEDPATQVE